MQLSNLLSGLYVITDARLQSPDRLIHQVTQAIKGGARIVQYRDKSQSQERRAEEASQLLNLCRSHCVALLINDDIELAVSIQADGVHIGRDDGEIQTARQRLGDQAIIGVSCYNEWHRAKMAAENGANYLAFGRFFPSSTKPDAVQATHDLIERAHRELKSPIVAIGGITPENGASLIEAGADMLAVVTGVFAQEDVRIAAQRYAQLFTPSH